MEKTGAYAHDGVPGRPLMLSFLMAIVGFLLICAGAAGLYLAYRRERRDGS